MPDGAAYLPTVALNSAAEGGIKCMTSDIPNVGAISRKYDIVALARSRYLRLQPANSTA